MPSGTKQDGVSNPVPNLWGSARGNEPERGLDLCPGHKSRPPDPWCVIARPPVPMTPGPLDEQKQVRSRLRAAQEILEAGLAMLRKLQQEKKELIHDLLTGHMRVNVV